MTVGNAVVRIGREVVFPVGAGALLAAVAALQLGDGGFLVGTGARRFGLRLRDGGAEPA